ncbi:MAG: ThiF family adenylyltransferase, partial [Janthinobacterium lividum]
GCGGTGSQMLTGLAQMHATLSAMHLENMNAENPFIENGCRFIENGCRCRGLKVTVYDPDVVTEFNIGRQLFYPADLGMNKALCLVSRVNMAYGTKWIAVPEEYHLVPLGQNMNQLQVRYSHPDILISCTDTASSRRGLHRFLWSDHWSRNADYWLDCANLATVGQVVLGQPGRENEERWPRSKEFDPGVARWKGQRRTQIKDENDSYDASVSRRTARSACRA